jgi:hypothetical protein
MALAVSMEANPVISIICVEDAFSLSVIRYQAAYIRESGSVNTTSKSPSAASAKPISPLFATVTYDLLLKEASPETQNAYFIIDYKGLNHVKVFTMGNQS